ncbi:M48 family metalloprotease [Dactylosporangium sp. AC04546]|uniref:M48 family metallopeptidase n=1 Tax=Dactylosporangium sp. AC04546 TaxID=2862460 RepID=UPI001EDD46E7|nr:M48 family metallopeptidase [Dactylosporangium sp. AC04546]WVK78406.1 M48 family metalloprotease [Dactylosporangium sp. AC04546]
MLIDKVCPGCAGELVADVPAWCASCEWGLGRFDARRAPRVWGLRAADRVDHWLAFRLNRRQYDELAGRAVDERAPAGRRAGLLLVALPLALLGPACVAGGVVLTMLAGWLGVGLALVALGVALLWPHRQADPWGEWPLTPAEAPAFFALIRRVADAAGTPGPDAVALSHDVSAHMTLRGRRSLVVGLPLWGALDGPERVVLLAHEMGHFVNHDGRRHVVVRAAYHTVQTLYGGVAGSARRLVFAPLFLAVGVPLWGLFAGLLVLGGRDSQRAEDLADQVATRVGGTAAAARLLDALVTLDGLYPAMGARHLNHADPADWRTAAGQLRASTDVGLARLRSVRVDASLLVSHPPAGLRGRMVRSRPQHPPALVVDDAEWAAIDAELAPWFARLRARVRELHP